MLEALFFMYKYVGSQQVEGICHCFQIVARADYKNIPTEEAVLIQKHAPNLNIKYHKQDKKVYERT